MSGTSLSDAPAANGPQRLAQLADRFKQQAGFARDYSPLYSRLFNIFAGWLAAPESAADPLVNWLVEAAAGRSTLEVTLLLLGGLHRRVLAGQEPALAAYFPTAGGTQPDTDPRLPELLHEVVLANREELAAFLQEASVQTNETGRGLAWVLPLSFVPWPAVQLLDLGASAGLNLVADRRSYELVDPYGRQLLVFGAPRPVQFTTICQGETEPLTRAGKLPHITGRFGCDLRPFPLQTVDDELNLMSFVWGDHPARLARLREGIAARRQVDAGDVPVRLQQATLPQELPRVLESIGGAEPLVIYNTYMTFYLEEDGAGLRPLIANWANKQHRPVLWLQWEPDRDEEPPHYGWGSWTADLWTANGTHRPFRLGWVHPHGLEAHFEPGLADWIKHFP